MSATKADLRSGDELGSFGRLPTELINLVCIHAHPSDLLSLACTNSFITNSALDASFTSFYLHPGNIRKFRRRVRNSAKGRSRTIANGKVVLDSWQDQLKRVKTLYLADLGNKEETELLKVLQDKGFGKGTLSDVESDSASDSDGDSEDVTSVKLFPSVTDTEVQVYSRRPVLKTLLQAMIPIQQNFTTILAYNPHDVEFESRKHLSRYALSIVKSIGTDHYRNICHIPHEMDYSGLNFSQMTIHIIPTEKEFQHAWRRARIVSDILDRNENLSLTVINPDFCSIIERPGSAYLTAIGAAPRDCDHAQEPYEVEKRLFSGSRDGEWYGEPSTLDDSTRADYKSRVTFTDGSLEVPSWILMNRRKASNVLV